MKGPNQKVAKWPKCYFFFSSSYSSLQTAQFKMRLFHDGLYTKQQHFTLSSAWPHQFKFLKLITQEPGLHLQCYSFICTHGYKAFSNKKYLLFKIAELEICSVCTERAGLSIHIDWVLNRCLGQWFFSPYCTSTIADFFAVLWQMANSSSSMHLLLTKKCHKQH